MPAKQSLSFALEPRATLPFDDYVVDCAWSPDGSQLAVAGGEGKVALLSAAPDSLSLKVVGEHLLGTLAIAWQPHGRRFASAGQDGAVAIWDAEHARELVRFKPGLGAAQALQYAPNGELLAVAAGKVVSLWSPSGEKVHAFAPAASTAVALAFDKPGIDIGVALNGEIAVHRIEKSRYETRRYKWPAPSLTVNFSGNGRYLASGMADGTLHFWNRSTGNDVVLWDFSGRGPEGTRPVVLSGHTDRVDSFAWQPGGEHLVSGGRDWRLALWRPGKSREAIDVQMTDSGISVLRWSADGRRVAVGEKQGRVTVFELVSR